MAIAIPEFIPEIWSANILTALRSALTYGGAGIINRNYEGDIAQAGDTVHITSFADPAVRQYTPRVDITWDSIDADTRALLIDQLDYFAFTVDDVERRQALPGFVEETSRGASYNLATETDTYLSGLMEADVDAANQLGAVPVAQSSPGEAYALLVALRGVLKRANVPDVGRWVVIPPELYGVLLLDPRFVDASQSGSTETLRNGFVGRAAGFDVYEANTVPEATEVFTIIAGHPIATTFADQILETEAIRLENQFGDGVRGLHVYGAKVVRPTALATAEVEVTAT